MFLSTLFCVILCITGSLGVNTSAIDCLERLVPEITCYVLSRTLNTAHCSFNSHTADKQVPQFCALILLKTLALYKPFTYLLI